MARTADVLGDEPEGRAASVDRIEREREFGEYAHHRLRIVLARQLGENVGRGLDRVATRRLDRLHQRLNERMVRALACKKQHFGEPSGLARLGQDAQAFGEEQAFLAPMSLVAQVADPLRSEEHTSELQSLMRISYAVFCLKK